MAHGPHGEFSLEYILEHSTLPCFAARVAFRDVSNAIDYATVRACLVPPNIFIGNTAPYFLWPRGDAKDQAFLLGVLSSISLDWYARRFVDKHVSLFIINAFPIPRPTRDNPLWRRIVELAGRLACPDKRFEIWAKEVGVECGALAANKKETMTHEIDAVVAHLYGLNEAQLTHIFQTFKAKNWEYQERLDAVLKHYRTWKSKL